jgi:hypothetical protein
MGKQCENSDALGGVRNLDTTFLHLTVLIAPSDLSPRHDIVERIDDIHSPCGS